MLSTYNDRVRFLAMCYQPSTQPTTRLGMVIQLIICISTIDLKTLLKSIVQKIKLS